MVEIINMSTLKRKIKMRDNLTTSVNTLVKEAEEKIIHCEETNTFNEEIISYKDTLVEKIEKIKEYNDQIIDLIETGDDLAQEEKTDTQFSIMCKNKLRFIDKFIGKHSITESVISTNLQVSRNIPNVKLPKLEIKPFAGQPENWHEFWDSFNCTIHQSDISNVQKMTYLKNLVIGSAAATIAGFKLSNENYT